MATEGCGFDITKTKIIKAKSESINKKVMYNEIRQHQHKNWKPMLS
jgi:hypothetical protein